MAKSPSKITLAPSRDIPFNKLVLSRSNVRRVKAGVSIEELAEDIARRGLLQGLNVRAVVNPDGVETGMFEIPAGGRRYRALERLVRQKRMAKTTPVPCVVREGGLAEEDSLAENIQRAPLHPLDQFRAFLALREKGQSEEEIAAAFFVSVAVVRQRLKLASVLPALLDAYAEDELSLDQIMAFTVNPDHERQQQVFDRIRQSRTGEPYAIRRMLTEGSVRACDKRALFIGLKAYVEAGGAVLNDLFQGDDGGWLQDVALVERLVSEKLERQAEALRAEGWKWVEVAPDLPYGYHYGLRRLSGEPAPLTPEEKAARAALRAEYDALDTAHAGEDELPEGVDVRFAEIETALAHLEDRPIRFEPAEVARAGAFLSIEPMGQPRIERGYVRPEDEPAVEPDPTAEPLCDAGEEHGERTAAREEPRADVLASQAAGEPESEEDDALAPIPDRLMTELTSYRTLALRHAMGGQPDIAFLAALHALCLKVFFRFGLDTCLDLDLRVPTVGSGVPGFGDSEIARSLDARHQQWSDLLPKASEDLWDALTAFDGDSRQALFAHCVSMSVNAVYEPYNRRPRAQAHAGRLAEALDVDMNAAGWRPTVETFLGRVTKARARAAIREARGDALARRLEGLKKGEAAERAEALLEGTGWLPEPLRTPGRAFLTERDVGASDDLSKLVEEMTDAIAPAVAEGQDDGVEPLDGLLPASVSIDPLPDISHCSV